MFWVMEISDNGCAYFRLSVCYIQIMGLHCWLLAPMLFISCGNGKGVTEILMARFDWRTSFQFNCNLVCLFSEFVVLCPFSLLHLLHLHLNCGNLQMGFWWQITLMMATRKKQLLALHCHDYFHGSTCCNFPCIPPTR